MDDDKPWDLFFGKPAISFTTQANLKSLFAALVDAQRVTFLLGAGVSRDSGLPSWDSLVSRIIELADDSDKRWAPLVVHDGAEPTRKAEYILSIASDHGTRTPGDLIRDALYKANISPTPGNLGDSLARLISILGHRARVVTTNYDTLLESALKTYVGDSSPVTSRTLSEYLAESDGEGQFSSDSHTVVHVHGILEPGQDPRGPVILTESLFLKHQREIQDFIVRALADSDVVVIVGMSITDPNIIGPLWKLSVSAASKPRVFNVAVVTGTAPDGDSAPSLNDSRAYAYRRAHFLETTFEVENVYLKTYAQVPQLFYEASLALVVPDSYLGDDPGTSARYGFRLQRSLDAMYSTLGCEPDEDYIPYGADAEDLSSKLHSHLYGEGGLVAELRGFAEGLSNSNIPKKQQIWERFSIGFDKENFGLFLWLRARGGRDAEYAIRLIGTSTYQHREAWSLDRKAIIRPGTRHPAAQCLLDGRPIIRDIPDVRSFALWGCLAATPFTVTGSTVTAMHPLGDVELDVLQVGAITLNSTNLLLARDQSQNERRASILSFLSPSEKSRLFDGMAKIAMSVTSPLL